MRLSRGRSSEEGRVPSQDANEKPAKSVAIVSYDEKPGIQAIATTAPDLPPEPGTHATFARDHEYKRHGTLSLLAGIDLLTGKVHALVKDRHRSREFIEFLKLLDAAYPARTAIKLILDNHSAHISKETKAWLADPAGRSLRVHLHPQARLLAQPRRGLLLQVRPLGPAPHPRRIQTRTQGTHHGRYRRLQSPTPSSTLGPISSTKPHCDYADGGSPLCQPSRRHAAPLTLRRLYIARDADAAGDAAATERAEADGIEALRLSPRLGDFNEDLRAFGVDDLRAALRIQFAPQDVVRFILWATAETG